MKIEMREKTTFKLRLKGKDDGLTVLEINTPNNEIKIWLVKSELEELKKVLNI